jgi:hypothetical protein
VLLAIFFQPLAIGLGGIAAGSTLTTDLMVLMGFTDVPIISILGGVLGGLLWYVLFDGAIISGRRRPHRFSLELGSSR